MTCNIGLEGVCPRRLFDFQEVLGDVLGRLRVWLASGRELCRVVPGNAGIVDEELDTLWFFGCKILCVLDNLLFDAEVAWEAIQQMVSMILSTTGYCTYAMI